VEKNYVKQLKLNKVTVDSKLQHISCINVITVYK